MFQSYEEAGLLDIIQSADLCQPYMPDGKCKSRHEEDLMGGKIHDTRLPHTLTNDERDLDLETSNLTAKWIAH